MIVRLSLYGFVTSGGLPRIRVGMILPGGEARSAAPANPYQNCPGWCGMCTPNTGAAVLHVSHTLTMWILPLVGYLGVLLGFGFLTLAIGTAHPSPFSPSNYQLLSLNP